MAIMEKQGIVLIDPDNGARKFITELAKGIEQVEIAGETTDLGKGYDMVRHLNPAIVILDLYPSADLALRLAERIFQFRPNTLLLVTSFENDPETILKAMRAGAREFLAKPLEREAVEKALTSAMHILERAAMAGSRNGKLISIFGVKGGVGTTTLASNLAVNIADRSKKDVVLVDMNLQFGNATLFLNLKPQTSIIDVQRHISEIDPEQLRKSLPRHSSGVSLLTGPIRVEEAETFETSKFEAIISLLRVSYNYILIDLPKNFDDLTMKTLDGSDVILKVFTTDIPSLFNTFRCFDIFKRLGYGEEKVLPVVNRFDDDGGNALGQLKKPLAYPVFWKIPNQDYKTIISSINLGKPLSSDTPRSQFSQSIAELAEKLIGEDERGDGAEGEKEKEGIFKKIFRKKET